MDRQPIVGRLPQVSLDVHLCCSIQVGAARNCDCVCVCGMLKPTPALAAESSPNSSAVRPLYCRQFSEASAVAACTAAQACALVLHWAARASPAAMPLWPV